MIQIDTSGEQPWNNALIFKALHAFPQRKRVFRQRYDFADRPVSVRQKNFIAVLHQFQQFAEFGLGFSYAHGDRLHGRPQV